MKRRCWPAPVLTAGLTLFLFSLFHLYPFAQQTLAWCDMKQQVIPFLLDFQNILQGSADLFLNTQNAGGMSFLGVFFFFLSSPFTFLILFVPAQEMYLFANILVLLKMAFCSYTAAHFFKRQFKNLSTVQVTAFSLMYAFSGYTMLYFQNMVWLDVMAIFPLLLMGLRQLAEEKRVLCFSLSLSAIMVLNFYLTYMVVVFIILSFGIFLFITQPKAERRQSVVLLGLSTVGSLLLTGVVWLPSLFQYLQSARTVKLIDSISTGSFFTSFYTTLPILLCSAGVFSGLFFLNKREAWQRPQTKALLIVWALLVLPLFIEPINKMWHTGSYQAFPARYGYMTALLGILFLVKAVSDLNAKDSSFFYQDWPGIGIGIFLFASLSMAAYLLLYYRYRDLTIYTRTLWNDQNATFYFLLFTVMAALSYYLLLYLYRHQYLTKRFFSMFLLLLVCCEAVFSSSVYIGSAANLDTYYRPVLDLKNRIEQTELYRVKNNHKYFDVNLLGALNYPTLNHYTSLTNQNFMFTMKRMGYSSYWMEVSSHGGTELSDALLGNQYTVLRSYETEDTDNIVYENDSYALVKNPKLLSFGTVFSSDNIKALQELPDQNRMGIQQSLFSAIFNTDEKVIEQYEPSTITNLHYNEVGGQSELLRQNPEKDGELVYHILVEGTQTLYLDCFDQVSNHLSEPVNNSLGVVVNDSTVEYQYPTQSENGLLKLGTFTDETVEVRLLVRHDFLAKSFGVFGLNKDTLQAAAEKAPKVQLYQQNNIISGKAQASAQGQYLFVPLPYQQGYSAKVNGQQAQVYRVFGDLLAIPLQEGANDVKITFVPQGIAAGFALTGFGALYLIGFFLLLKKGKYKVLRPLETVSLWTFRLLAIAVFAGIYVFPIIAYIVL